MEKVLIKKVIEDLANKKSKILVISCEGRFTFSNSGFIKSYDDDYLELQTSDSTELIKIDNIIKIKTLVENDRER